MHPSLALPADLVAEIRRYYEGQDPGHDWAHIRRVMATASVLAQSEKADLAVVMPAALLHDIVNVPKNHPERHRASELAADKAIAMLSGVGYAAEKLPAIHLAIVEHSWSKGLKPSCVESAVVQDADRLDALGAIGVLRCAAVNVAMGGAFYDPEDPFAEARARDDKKFMLDHYEAKLFKLSESMSTATGRKLAEERTLFMRSFVAQLGREIGR